MLTEVWTSDPIPVGVDYLMGLAWAPINNSLIPTDNTIFLFAMVGGVIKQFWFLPNSGWGTAQEGTVFEWYDPLTWLSLSHPINTQYPAGYLVSTTSYNPGSGFIATVCQSALNNLYYNRTDNLEANLETFTLLSIASSAGVAAVPALGPTGTPIYASLFGLAFFNIVNLDEGQEILMNAVGNALSVYNLTTGALQYTMLMPDVVLSINTQNDNQAYILCQNRVLVLLDYTTGTIMGAVRIPQLAANVNASFAAPAGGVNPQALFAGTQAQPQVATGWYPPLALYLIAESDGTTGVVIRGYALNPQPTRLTTPIPLQSPLRGNTIQVLTQIVDDLNFGIGGAVVIPALMAASNANPNGSIVGLPITDFQGNARIQVKCVNVGTIAINCTATVQDETLVIVTDDPGATS